MNTTEAPRMTSRIARAPVVRIVVYGSPAPQGSKRHVGNGRMIESSKKVKPWRQDVKAEAREVIDAIRDGDMSSLACSLEPGAVNSIPQFPFEGAVCARMVFTLPKPRSAPKKKTTYPCRKPDLSKLVRSTEDALTDAGFWRDDARVIEYTRLAKVFPNEDEDSLGEPGVVIDVWQA